MHDHLQKIWCRRFLATHISITIAMPILMQILNHPLNDVDFDWFIFILIDELLYVTIGFTVPNNRSFFLCFLASFPLSLKVAHIYYNLIFDSIIYISLVDCSVDVACVPILFIIFWLSFLKSKLKPQLTYNCAEQRFRNHSSSIKTVCLKVK